MARGVTQAKNDSIHILPQLRSNDKWQFDATPEAFIVFYVRALYASRVVLDQFVRAPP